MEQDYHQLSDRSARDDEESNEQLAKCGFQKTETFPAKKEAGNARSSIKLLVILFYSSRNVILRII